MQRMQRPWGRVRQKHRLLRGWDRRVLRVHRSHLLLAPEHELHRRLSLLRVCTAVLGGEPVLPRAQQSVLERERLLLGQVHGRCLRVHARWELVYERE